MDKKSTQTIKEVIEYLLKLRFSINYNRIKKLENEKIRIEESKQPKHPMGRERVIDEEIDFNKYIMKDIFLKEYEEKGLEVLNDNSEEYNKEIDEQLIKLNSLLDKNDKVKEVIDIEQQMKKIQSKKYITVKEFTEIYNIGKTSQQNYRSRLYDPLPYHQKVAGGKIVYVVKEVEEWFDNQHK